MRIVLADIQGTVVYDSSEGHSHRELTSDEEAAARNILVDDEVVGRLVVALPMHQAELGPLERGYLTGLQRWLVFGAPVAAAVGLLLGLAFSRSLTAPLQRLATAARSVATGDFSRRIPVGGSAEVAEVSKAFNEMSEALEKAEEQRQNMVADVAHELRTPLSVIQGNLRAMLDGVYPMDKNEVSRVYDQTLLLSRLVGDLRELALADTGQLSLNLQATDVYEVVRTTTESISQSAREQGVSLTTQVPDHLPAVQADPDRLGQVLHNLLANALQHTPSGGSVMVAASAAGDAVEIAVADTGEGIAQEALPHIFDRFWRADPSRARDDWRAGGAGLGLSIAHSLVEAHGGRIWAESTTGEGTTFRFTLPLKESAGEGDAG
jgi:two-component system OmpR family sensor kinase/two-component system sensor histidine kinase BaeS